MPTPDWTKTTPEEVSYDLTMFAPGGEALQDLAMNRDEYLAMKAHLSAIRGFDYADQLAKLEATDRDKQQLAFKLETAREVYRDYPALVMAEELPERYDEYCEVQGEAKLELGNKTEDRKNFDHVVAVLRTSIQQSRDLDLVLFAIEAITRHGGCTTPAESFVRNTLKNYGDGLTPEHVQDDLEEFKLDFAAISENCEYAHRFYPELAAKAAETAKAKR